MRNLLFGSVLLLGAGDTGCEPKSEPGTSARTIHQESPSGLRVLVVEYRGNEYIVVKEIGECSVAVCPALPAKAEK